MSGTSEQSTFHKIYLHSIFQNLPTRLKIYSPRSPLGTVTFSPEIGWKKQNSWASGQPSGYRAWPDLFSSAGWHNSLCEVLSCYQHQAWPSWPPSTGSLIRGHGQCGHCLTAWHTWAWEARSAYCC